MWFRDPEAAVFLCAGSWRTGAGTLLLKQPWCPQPCLMARRVRNGQENALSLLDRAQVYLKGCNLILPQSQLTSSIAANLSDSQEVLSLLKFFKFLLWLSKTLVQLICFVVSRYFCFLMLAVLHFSLCSHFKLRPLCNAYRWVKFVSQWLHISVFIGGIRKMIESYCWSLDMP